MNWHRVEHNWQEFSNKVKQQWGKLTDDDISLINGRREVLEGVIQKQYGVAREKARKEVDYWLART